ncbi:hypothetical protein [uncultured Bacteroides sp.]|uniref:hypothetical protein n=1 Tax=uncultured Bacteroides sp. TaxID=162156 RepID=UPI00260F7F3D|nr:hypothetical protein [uncultured Bacteroides sp.]
MDSKHIEQLLERYWQCETSLQEEAELRTFFSGEDIPEHLLRYRDLFIYQQLQQDEHLGEDFDKRILALTEEVPVVKARRISLTQRFMPLFKAAAALALVLTMGNIMQHSFFYDVQEVAAADTIGQQINAPSVAQSTETFDKLLIDSLKHIEKEELNKKYR